MVPEFRGGGGRIEGPTASAYLAAGGAAAGPGGGPGARPGARAARPATASVQAGSCSLAAAPRASAKAASASAGRESSPSRTPRVSRSGGVRCAGSDSTASIRRSASSRPLPERIAAQERLFDRHPGPRGAARARRGTPCARRSYRFSASRTFPRLNRGRGRRSVSFDRARSYSRAARASSPFCSYGTPRATCSSAERGSSSTMIFGRCPHPPPPRPSRRREVQGRFSVRTWAWDNLPRRKRLPWYRKCFRTYWAWDDFPFALYR